MRWHLTDCVFNGVIVMHFGQLRLVMMVIMEMMMMVMMMLGAIDVITVIAVLIVICVVVCNSTTLLPCTQSATHRHWIDSGAWSNFASCMGAIMSLRQNDVIFVQEVFSAVTCK